VVDVVLARADRGEFIAVEVHSQVHRLEQLIRWASLKCESLPSSQLWQALGGPIATASSCLILRTTSANRSIVMEYEQTLAAAFPASTAAAIASIRDGRPWPGAALLWADVEQGAATLRSSPPRGVNVGRTAADRESSNTG
jgi:hypothetical protein